MVGGYFFTKQLILRASMNIVLLLVLPLFISSNQNEAFSGVLSHCENLDNDVAAVASVLYAEGRGEGKAGRLAIIFAIRNRAKYYNEPIWKTCRRGMEQGLLTPGLVEEAREGLKMEVGHQYRHWLNFELATDLEWVAYAKKCKGLWIGRHFFF